MDPDVCLDKICCAYIARDWKEIRFACEDLLDWLYRVGNMPEISSGRFCLLLEMILRCAKSEQEKNK